jgi:multidrug efflux pump subunit AcrA (membrane-fusion protein)
MRFRLLRRRLTISAPRMAIRSALPWPIRWAIAAIVLGFCAAIGLWAFEFGRDIAGLDKASKEELAHARAELSAVKTELERVKDERDEAQSVANTADTRVNTEKASHERLFAEVKQLEQENRTLKDDLGFFEKLIPVAGVEGVAIRGLQVEPGEGAKIKWQVLVIQASRNAPELNGRLEINFSGLLNGKPWSAPLPGGGVVVKVRQYGRMEGDYELPAQVVLKSVSARLLEGTVVRATQIVKL